MKKHLISLTDIISINIEELSKETGWNKSKLVDLCIRLSIGHVRQMLTCDKDENRN